MGATGQDEVMDADKAKQLHETWEAMKRKLDETMDTHGQEVTEALHRLDGDDRLVNDLRMRWAESTVRMHRLADHVVFAGLPPLHFGSSASNPCALKP